MTIAATRDPSSLPDVPTMAELREVVPEECFERSTARSMAHAGFSLTLTLVIGGLAWAFLPLEWAWLPVWLLYALVTGTVATGVWVAAHECGHGAFSDRARLQNAVGFVLHSSLLVPYYSWQRSHAVHHARTNHLVEGETHVPRRSDTAGGSRLDAQRRRFGSLYPALAISTRLLFGWPLYLISGATGGERGTTNHFWPYAPFATSLFPDRWARRVLVSTLGVLVAVAGLTAWAISTSPTTVLALYGGPYLVVNAWLVTYTWLQHTNPDIPHFDEGDWSYVRGAFCSVDRPYGRVFDALHHSIGSTHVAHHLFHVIPHYRARLATEAIAQAYPELYRYDDTPVLTALWRAGSDCVTVGATENGWRYDHALSIEPERV